MINDTTIPVNAKVETSKRKTCNLSIRVTATELTWLAEKAQEQGCLSISEYTRNVLFQATKVDEHRAHIAQLEKDLHSLRQDVEKLSSRLSNGAHS